MSYFSVLNHSGFARGFVTYTDQFGESNATRIVVPVNSGSVVFTSAIVDTGGLWCVLDPEDAEGLDFDYKAEPLMQERLSILGAAVDGRLCTMSVSLEAELGVGVELECQVFIPTNYPGRTKRFPNILGLYDFLTDGQDKKRANDVKWVHGKTTIYPKRNRKSGRCASRTSHT
jgi:hypothetical protein